MNKILITRDSKGDIRYLKLSYHKQEDTGFYKIERSSGKLGGKDVNQPPLLVKAGKAKRTIKEQVDLEFNSLLTKAMSKGYKELSEFTDKPFDKVTTADIDQHVESTKTDMAGIRKPMLAKETSNAKPAMWNRYWRISKKLDGVRCMLYWDVETETIKTASRGGKNYDAATTHIRNIPRLVHLLRQRPGVMLDGEIYVHGMSLQEISGIARLKEYDPERCGVLEFHCYDLAVDEHVFSKRLEMLDKMRDYFIDETKIKVLEHFEIHGYDEAKAYHDNWVSQGYEGAILRDPTKEYGFGKRDVRMIKLKEFKDEEFEIIGYKLGLRGSEDMVFTLKTKDSIEFEAKPIGDRSLKERYVNDIKKIIGQKGTVKYFYMTEDGKPFLPVFKCVRNYE